MYKILAKKFSILFTLSAVLACYSCAKHEAEMIQTKPSSQLAAEKLAVNSLAQELSIPVNAISVVSAEAVEWPNPGLGCPDPDKFYPQVIVPGYKVTLDANGTHYPVHVGSDRAIVCHQ